MKKNNEMLEKWSPSVESVKHYIKCWDKLPNYVAQEKALHKLFHEYCKDNINIDDVLIKCSTLNDFYSTNIFNVFMVAEHYMSIKIDSRLKAGDLTLVDELSKIEINGKKYHFYSFATKYCSHHCPEIYPIYDNYVEKVLIHYRNVDNFFNFKIGDLREYTKYNEIIQKFKEFYHLEKYTVKQIDKYLWLLGKDTFPRKYKQEK